MAKRLFILIISLLLAAGVFAQYGNQVADTVAVAAGKPVAEQTYEWALIHYPSDYNTSPSKRHPMIIFLHGAGQAGTGQSGLSTLSTSQDASIPYLIAQGDSMNFYNPLSGDTDRPIIVSLQAQGWSTSGPQLEYAIGDLMLKFGTHLDTNRISTTGLSAGAQGCWDQMVRYDNNTNAYFTVRHHVASSVIMSAALNDGGAYEEPSYPQIIRDSIHLWGLADSINDGHGKTTARLVDSIHLYQGGAAGYLSPTFYQFPGNPGHCCWLSEYQPSFTQTIVVRGVTYNMNVYQFMMAWSKSGAIVSTPKKQPLFQVHDGEYLNDILNTKTGQVFDIIGNARPIAGIPFIISGAGGAHHRGWIDSTHHVWMQDDNTNGELGDSTTTGRSTPVKIFRDSTGAPFDSVAEMVCSAGDFGSAFGWTTFFRKMNGKVYMCGYGANGRRGNGTAGASIITQPVQVIFPAGTPPIVKIQGCEIGLALDSAGGVWTWGGNMYIYNAQYLLAQGTTSPNWYSPTKISLPGPAKDIAGGGYWNYAILRTGQLYGWSPYLGYIGIGYGNGGGVAYETPDAQTKPVIPLLLDSALNLPKPVAKININQIGTYAILTDSTAWFWGDNAQGGAGIGTEIDWRHYVGVNGYTPYQWPQNLGDLLIRKPVQIAPGKHNFDSIYVTNALAPYAWAIDSRDSLYAWGRGKSGMLGNLVRECDSLIGNVASKYPNSLDVPLITPVWPFTDSIYVSTSPICIDSSAAAGCPSGCVTVGSAPLAVFTIQVIGHNTVVLHSEASHDGIHIANRAFGQTAGTALAMGIVSGVTDTLTNVPDGTYGFSSEVINTNFQGTYAYVTVTIGGSSPGISPTYYIPIFRASTPYIKIN